MVYSGLFVLIAVFFNALWRYASYQNRLLHPNADRAVVTAITRQYAFGPVLYLVAFVLAWANLVTASLLLNLLLALFFALPGRSLPLTDNRQPTISGSEQHGAGDGVAASDRDAGLPAEIGEVDATRLCLLGEALGEIERLVHDLGTGPRVARPHLEQDRALGARRDDRIGHALDPHARSATVPALALAQWLERVDLVRARVFSETEEDHPVAVHGRNYRDSLG